MTEGEAGPDWGQRARLLAGRISCIVGLLLGAVQIYSSLLTGSANTSVGIFGIAFCILDSTKLATAIIFLCMAASQHAAPFGLRSSARLLRRLVSMLGLAPSLVSTPSSTACQLLAVTAKPGRARGTAPDVCQIRRSKRRPGTTS